MSDERTLPTRRWIRRPRLGGFAYDGDHAYHVAFNTAGRRGVLVDDLAEAVIDSLIRAAAATGFELLVYVVIPDHVHALIQALDPTANAVKFVQRSKQTPGFAYKQKRGEHLWQRSFYDRIVRRGDDAREIATYIFDNPLRAGSSAPARTGRIVAARSLRATQSEVDPTVELVREAVHIGRRVGGAEAPRLLV